MAEEEKQDKQDEKEQDKEKDPKSLDEENQQLEELLKAIRAVEEEKRKNNKGRKPKKRMIAIEFGSMFHTNHVVNFMVYYTLNLLVIYSVATLFNFGTFSGLNTVLLFVLAYTVTELVFRAYILSNHFKIVLKSFGFIFYFGYVTIFYIIEQYLFPQSVVFLEASLFLVFVGMFIVFRYMITQLIKNLSIKKFYQK